MSPTIWGGPLQEVDVTQKADFQVNLQQKWGQRRINDSGYSSFEDFLVLVALSDHQGRNFKMLMPTC